MSYNPYEAPLFSPYGPPPPQQKQSILGIISVAIGVLVGISAVVDVVVAGVVETNTPGGMNEESPEAILIGLVIIACIFFSLVGLGLAIGSFFQRDKKKLFGIMGLVFNAVVLLGISGIMCLGIMLG